MQFSLLAFVTLFAAVMAAPTQDQSNAPGKRQATQPSTQNAAMTNAAGEIVSFDAANVYLDAVAKGM